MLKEKRWILIFSFFVHCVFLVSIFDIYFKSPIVEGVAPIKNELRGAAKRLVLFVGDGLRADTFFNYDADELVAPYLRKIIEERGRWGLSHARVPTESRPGHVALIAGFYEDPSAIFKGWKDNPIEFDSVFNQSTLTVGWGSPDIVSMFNKGSSKSRVMMHSYPSSFQEFTGKEGSSVRLSQWSLDSFKIFLQTAKSDGALLEQLLGDGVIFFLHLLGIDTSGHSDKPHSKEYRQNIKLADDIVRQTEYLINEFYNNDGKTTFLFTSDHGMTDWGSHGEGSPSETEVPYVTWGAGVREPSRSYKISNPSVWSLDHLQRNDIKQADTVPLMSILLGISIPAHSIGILPEDILNYSLEHKGMALLLNARQILAQFIRKRKLVEDSTLKWLYKPFEPLINGKEKEIIHELELYLQKGYYDEVMSRSKKLISICLSGLTYYHNYYQTLLLFCTSISYVGWICWLFLNVASNKPMQFEFSELNLLRSTKVFALNAVFIVAFFCSVFLLAVQFLPIQYYLYCCLPLFIWRQVMKKLIHFELIVYKKMLSYSFIFTCLWTLIGTELMVMSFFDRRTLTLMMFLVPFWLVFEYDKKCRHLYLLLGWGISCIFLMIFPFLPVIGGKPQNLFLIFSVVLWWLFIFITYKSLKSTQPRGHTFDLTTSGFFIILSSIALITVIYATLSYKTEAGLSRSAQFFSWTILSLVPIIPLLLSKRLVIRLLSIYFSLGTVSLLFAVTHDAVFLPIFSCHLFLWFLLENNTVHDSSKFADLSSLKFSGNTKSKNIYLETCDLRRSFLFFFYTIFSFFATGNVASINSFDTACVRCFVTLFAPFTITILILVKTVIPFFLTACTFRAINTVTKAAVDKIFLIVLIYCDIMGLNFLFLVKNVGSWLEIGSSVSHYVISQTITLFLVLLYILSGYATCFRFKRAKRTLRSLKEHVVSKYVN